MKTVEVFYYELRSLLPEIGSMEVWKDFDNEGVGFIGAQIMTKIGEMTIEWTTMNKLELVERLFEFFELSYIDFEDGANAYIYTDFQPTIICSKDIETRDRIKKLMGPITKNHYDQLINLGLYQECLK